MADNQYEQGIFINADAIDGQQKEWLAKLTSSMLTQAGETSLIPSLMIPNQLTAEMGTQGKFYDWGQLIARYKPDAVPTDVQKIKPTSLVYELDEYEVKVGISDRSKINSQMSAQDLITKGNAARAFARAFDAQGLNEIVTNSNSTGGTAWASETDANIMDQISGILDEVWDEGYIPKALVVTQAQTTRLAKIGLTYSNPLTWFDLLKKQHTSLEQAYIWRKIKIKNPDGTDNLLFDPTGNFCVLDPTALGVFTQRPVTIEPVRDAFAGVDFAIMRKYFQTKIVQPDSGHLLTGLGI